MSTIVMCASVQIIHPIALNVTANPIYNASAPSSRPLSKNSKLHEAAMNDLLDEEFWLTLAKYLLIGLSFAFIAFGALLYMYKVIL